MLYLIYTLLINAVAIFITARLLDGVKIKSFMNSIWVAVLLAIVNTTIKPVMLFLTLPLTILTLGLFVLVINALMLMLVDAFVKGFKIRNFWWALIFSIVLSIINGLLFLIFT